MYSFTVWPHFKDGVVTLFIQPMILTPFYIHSDWNLLEKPVSLLHKISPVHWHYWFITSTDIRFIENPAMVSLKQSKVTISISKGERINKGAEKYTFCHATLRASFFFWSSSSMVCKIFALSFSTILFFFIRSLYCRREWCYMEEQTVAEAFELQIYFFVPPHPFLCLVQHIHSPLVNVPL